MQTDKNDTNDKKFADLVTENCGRKYYRHISNECSFHGGNHGTVSLNIALQ